MFLMQTPPISVIISAYNEATYIWPCLEHVLQYCDGLVSEIIVVDNASTDDTVRIASTYPYITVISELKKWVSFARQAWYLSSSWEILCFIDADTRMPSGRINRIITLFHDNNLWFVSGPCSYYDLSKYKQVASRLYRKTFVYVTYLIVWYMGVGGNFAMRRSALDQLWWFDTTIAFYGDDTDIARRASQITKVTFDLGLTMPTSWRRFVWQWFWQTIYLYTINYFSQIIKHSPATDQYEDWR